MLQTPSDSLKAYALNQLQRAIACLSWRGSRAHAGVHQARKSMRRARACLALGESALGAGANMIDRELSKICGSLSSLRDAQARVESLDRLLANNLNDVEFGIRPCLTAAKRLAVLALIACLAEFVLRLIGQTAINNHQQYDLQLTNRRSRSEISCIQVGLLLVRKTRATFTKLEFEQTLRSWRQPHHVLQI